MKKYIAAIDLGTTKIVAIVGERLPSGKFRVLGHYERPSKGILRGEVYNIDGVAEAVQPALEEVEKLTGIKMSEVYVGIAGQRVRCVKNRFEIPRNNYNKTISEDEISELVKKMHEIETSPGEEVLHVVPQRYTVDEWSDIVPVGAQGRKLNAEFTVFLGKTSAADRTRKAIENMGLKLERTILEPLASAEAVLDEHERDMGVLLVDIGGGTTDLVIYRNNIVRHIAVIPFGGNVITKDIQEVCSILPRQAEQLKVQYGSCYAAMAVDNKIIAIPGICGREPREVSFKLLAQIIEARMDEIMEAVMFEVERSGYADKLSAGMVVTGGGANLGNLPEYILAKTGLEARRGRPVYLTSDSSEEVLCSAYATAAGLLMKGYEYEEEKEKQLVYVENPISTLSGLWKKLFPPNEKKEVKPEQRNLWPEAELPPPVPPKPKPPKPPKPERPPRPENRMLDIIFNVDNEV